MHILRLLPLFLNILIITLKKQNSNKSFTVNVLNASISSVVVLKTGSEFSPESWDDDVPNDKTREVFVENMHRKDDNGPQLNTLRPK